MIFVAGCISTFSENPCVCGVEGDETHFQDFLYVGIPGDEFLNSTPIAFNAILADETHRLCR
jgi:hypothetical protein